MFVQKRTTERVRQSLGAMLVARPLSAVAGLIVLVMLSVNLSVAEYGMYFSIWATTEILILTSNMGLVHAVYRYVAAVERQDNKIVPEGPARLLLLARIVTLIAAGSITYLVVVQAFPVLAEVIQPEHAMFLVLLVVGEGLARYFEAMFDAMLTQWRSQATLVARTVLKMLGIGLIVLWYKEITLTDVLFVETLAVLMGCALGALMLMALDWKSTSRSGSQGLSVGRMMRFAGPSYAAQLVGLTYSIDAMKLALAKAAGQEAVAVFGFAYSLAAVVSRYLPASLLAGVLRPVFVEAATKQHGGTLLGNITNLSLKVNWLYVGVIVSLTTPVAETLTGLLSGGKYEAAGGILVVLLCGLFVLAAHLTLAMVSLAQENSWPVLVSTGAAAISLPLGILMAAQYGASGMAVAFIIAEAVWVVVWRLTNSTIQGASISIESWGLVKIAAAVAASAVASLACNSTGAVWWLFSSAVGFALFGGITAAANVFNAQERQLAVRALPNWAARLLKARVSMGWR